MLKASEFEGNCGLLSRECFPLMCDVFPLLCMIYSAEGYAPTRHSRRTFIPDMKWAGLRASKLGPIPNEMDMERDELSPWPTCNRVLESFSDEPEKIEPFLSVGSIQRGSRIAHRAFPGKTLG